MHADSPLTMSLKNFVLSDLNADLVGVANVERFENAPLRMSPQGLMPDARSAIVMAVHHPDACIELGGLEHPQEIGPYRIQYQMNNRLDEMSYRTALWLQEQGFRALPVCASNIWRYKGYKELTEQFAPDMSHLHAAVAAGLAEFGYQGLAITPEFGARQRYVSVVTDAGLTPTPLLEPGSVCDECMLCARHCRAEALTRELDGWNLVRIEDNEYRYVRKNLWRCSWGEHFDLDLDLPIPDVVTEEVIREMEVKHGVRSGEMGSCLRHCLPKARRRFEPDYTDAPRRIRAQPTDGPVHRGLVERVRSLPARWGVERVAVAHADALCEADIDLADYLPDGRRALTFAVPTVADAGGEQAPDGHHAHVAREYLAIQAAYDIARELERAGYSAVLCTDLPEDRMQSFHDLPEDWQTMTVVTSAPLPATNATARKPVDELDHVPLGERLHGLATDVLPAAMVGVASSEVLARTAEALRPVYEGEPCFGINERAPRFQPADPEVTELERAITPPDGLLPGARSVVVLGIPLPAATVDCAGRTPAEAIGPYAFAQYESARLLRTAAWRLCRELSRCGYRATWSFDLLGTGGTVANPRGPQPDAFCNRFAAVASGLARLSRAGFPVTVPHGTNVRFVAVITDALLRANTPLAESPAAETCGECTRCISACRTGAFDTEPVSVPVGPVSERFLPVRRIPCDWAKVHSLIADEGNKHLGWDLNLPIPDDVTPEDLARAIRQQPAIPRYRPCNFELCVLACPLARPQAGVCVSR
jgi:epoxyqueuosine reductase QueG